MAERAVRLNRSGGLRLGWAYVLSSAASGALGVSGRPTYAGLAGNFLGLYEFYITVPAGLANGDYQINVTQGGVAAPQTMYLTVEN